MSKRNPNAGFDPFEVPASDDERSRFSLAQTPGGIAVGNTAQGIAAAYSQIADERTAAASPAKPEPKSVRLGAIVKVGDEYQAVYRGTVVKIPEVAAIASGQYKSQSAEGAVLLDEFVLGKDVRSDQVWKALRDLCQQEKASSAVTRHLSDVIARLVLLSHGIVATRSELPTEHLNVERAAA